ncbi:MAG TPA: proteasome assembly chaperone family protein [Candidatus Methanomethylia archaeon]|nr:proteasome assembly chaperone family protein [Candidatus Methanomethylicia archaeon]
MQVYPMSPNVDIVTFADIPRRPAVLLAGLPGIGLVGKIALDYLVKKLNSSLVSEVYLDSFPPQVNLNDRGVVELLRGELYYAETVQGKPLLLFTASAQPSSPEGQYLLSKKVVELAVNAGVEEIFTLAAYVTGEYSERPRVFVAATDEGTMARLKEAGATIASGGAITGVNGLIVGFAKLRGLKGACLMGETSGYIVDAAAAYAVLELLSKFLGLEVDMEELERRAREVEVVIRRMREEIMRMAEKVEKEKRPGEAPSYIS